MIVVVTVTVCVSGCSNTYVDVITNGFSISTSFVSVFVMIFVTVSGACIQELNIAAISIKTIGNIVFFTFISVLPKTRFRQSRGLLVEHPRDHFDGHSFCVDIDIFNEISLVRHKGFSIAR